MRQILFGLIAIAMGCSGNETTSPADVQVFFPVASETYVLGLVNQQPLPVKSPYGAGEWDYDSDAGTWQLTAATLTLKAAGTFTNTVTHQAASGNKSSQTFAGRYTRVFSSSLQFSENGLTYSAEISGNRLIMKFADGTTFTFERSRPSVGA